MKWLTQMEIDAGTARRYRFFDSYSWHKGVWQCFPSDENAARDFLTRLDALEGKFRVWLLSARKPQLPEWCPQENFFLKEIAPGFLHHHRYYFDVRANPVKNVVQRDAEGNRIRGKRIPIVDTEELRSWLSRKGDARCRDPKTGKEIPGGFRLLDSAPLDISPMAESHFRKKSHSAYHGGVQFRGILEVTNRELFQQTYSAGIGSAKGFGFGLLLLKPVN
ncbi:type I-E CRISPR-associated protein Cas6/Cse3/CasE [Chrysiogenes arsenatis]|uniref:type I-E CRISPR-associated protein Cas6/Cse3/CasE n=1 Tax=Chrysiogenes arsenatis TaxID=309797 RepID=UPI000482551B|nr:type I-E CRISPR-associated protein Cas6/Cse3/CasE [Chrysiogenes arsenatis]